MIAVHRQNFTRVFDPRDELARATVSGYQEILTPFWIEIDLMNRELLSMTRVRRYDLGTGHSETIAETETEEEAIEIEERYLEGDHGTDVVVYHEEG